MLNENNYTSKIIADSTDGKNYISIVNPATTLGKMLKPDHIYPFDTVFGKVVNVRRFMEYLNKEDYPIKFLTKQKLTASDIVRIRKCNIKHIKNYWAYILYALIKRVSKDTKLQELILANDLEYVAIDNGLVKEELFNTEIYVKKHLTKLSYYVSCVRIVAELVKSNKLNDNVYISKMLDNEVNGNFLEKIANVNKLV